LKMVIIAINLFTLSFLCIFYFYMNLKEKFHGSFDGLGSFGTKILLRTTRILHSLPPLFLCPPSLSFLHTHRDTHSCLKV
jgi:hypothetical protein